MVLPFSSPLLLCVLLSPTYAYTNAMSIPSPVVQGGRSVVVMTLDPKREKEEDRDKRTHTSRRRSAD